MVRPTRYPPAPPMPPKPVLTAVERAEKHVIRLGAQAPNAEAFWRAVVIAAQFEFCVQHAGGFISGDEDFLQLCEALRPQPPHTGCLCGDTSSPVTAA